MLRDEIEAAKRTVNTDRVQITIGEVATMYSADELNILPDFQRLHRWGIVKKSNFIESVLIGIPIPPIFVFESDEGIWELVDGLQRVSTILEFMGILEDVDRPGQHKRSVLSAAKYLPHLEGVVWQAQSDSERTLDKSLQLFFRRARLDFESLRLAGRGEKIHEMVCRCGGRVPIHEVWRARRTTATIRTDPGVNGTLGTCASSNASNEASNGSNETRGS